MRTFAIVSQKGGVGKTTLAINLSATLAKLGRRVLGVDLDPQGHWAVGVALPDEGVAGSIHDCLETHRTSAPIDLSRVTWQVAPNYDLAPASRALADFDRSSSNPGSADARILKEVTDAAAHKYDVCVIDCPPYLGTLMYNAIHAADEVLIPVETSYFALHELPRQLAKIEAIAAGLGRCVPVHVVPTQYDVRTKLAREILAELRARHAAVLTRTVINFNTKLKEGACYGQPITEYAPGSTGARDFESLAREVLTRTPPGMMNRAAVESVAAQLAADSDRLLATSKPLIAAGASPTRAAVSGPIDSVSARTTSSVGLSPAGSMGTAVAAPVDRRTIDEKIAAIYGAQATADGVIFRTQCPDARLVQLAGDFNDWMPHTTPLHRVGNGGVFETRLRLPQGRYRYRLVIDGRWAYDRDNPLVEANEYGEINSVVEVT